MALMGHAHKMGTPRGNLVGGSLLVDGGPIEHGLGTLWEVGCLGNDGGGVVGCRCHGSIIIVTGERVGGWRQCGHSGMDCSDHGELVCFGHPRASHLPAHVCVCVCVCVLCMRFVCVYVCVLCMSYA